MGSLEAEEALLKKKLEETDVLEERREIRKQLRELRNKKFEEEVKKVTASDYRPGRDRAAVTNGGDSALERIGRSRSIQKDEGEDTYGLSSIDNEDDLQAMLNDTPFTETDKRKKIRARLREIRNQKLGIGEPVIIKRHQHQEKTSPLTADGNDKKNDSSIDQKTSTRNSYNSRYNRSNEHDFRNRSEGVVEPAGNDLSISRKEDAKSSRNRIVNDENDIALSEEVVGKDTKNREDEVAHDNDRYEDESSSLTNSLTETKGLVSEDEKIDEKVEERLENDLEDVPNDDDQQSEELEEEKTPENDDKYSEDDQEEDNITDNRNDNEKIEYEERDDSVDYEEDKEEAASFDKKFETQNDEDDPEKSDSQHSDEDDDDDYSEEVDADDNKAVSYRNDDSYLDDEEEDESVAADVSNSEKEKQQDHIDYEDDENFDEEYSEDGECDAEESRSESIERYEQNVTDEQDVAESNVTKRQSQEEYSDEYSESYSDYTPTDEGSSIGGRRFDDDQNLDDYENDPKRSVQRVNNYSPKSSSLSRAQGPSYSSKIDKVFQEKEPGVKEGKDFKEKLKKTEKPFNQQTSKKGGEQVDFRTVLRASEKPKFFGDKPSQAAEQVDFRNLLQKKVNTKTLADRDLRAEQVDFRTVLKAGSVEKKPVPTRKTSAAEQVDFRTVLKKEPSVKSRKVSTDDKEIFRKIRDGRKTSIESSVAVDEKNASERSSRSGRPSIDVLKRSGSLDKARQELNKKRTESIDSESGTALRKAGRPSLDALKESGDLGKTKEKTAKFEQDSETVFKKPAAPVPKQKSAKIVEEDEDASENNEKSRDIKTISQTKSLESEEGRGTQENRRQRRAIKEEKKEQSHNAVEGDNEEDTERKPRSKRSLDREERSRLRRNQNKDESSDKPRTRRVIKMDDPVIEEKASSENKKANDASSGSESKKESAVEKPPQESDDRRSSLKSGDKRARNRRLRRDQNEVVKEAEAKHVSTKTQEDIAENNDEGTGNDDAAITANVERVSVRTSSTSRSSVQVILSTNRRSEKEQRSLEDNQADSDNDEIGMRRNRRRLQRKGSTDDQQPIRVSVKSERKKDSPTNDNGTAISIKTVNDTKVSRNVDNADGDETKESSAILAKVMEQEKKKPAEELKKSRQTKMADLDAKLAERRRQRAMEKRKKQEQAKNSRMAFKEKLDAGAPTTNGSQSPALQRANSNMKKLLHWCQRLTDGYPDVSVTNFTTSWSDGLAFCALLHNFVPDKIPFDELTRKTSRRNFELAFMAASDEGVPEFLEVDDMVNMESPDPKSVITYLHAIYQTFVADRR